MIIQNINKIKKHEDFATTIIYSDLFTRLCLNILNYLINHLYIFNFINKVYYSIVIIMEKLTSKKEQKYIINIKQKLSIRIPLGVWKLNAT